MRVVARDCTLEGSDVLRSGHTSLIYRSVGAACISQMLWNRCRDVDEKAPAPVRQMERLLIGIFWLIIY